MPKTKGTLTMTPGRALTICGALFTALPLSTAYMAAQTPTLITIYDFSHFQETGSCPQASERVRGTEEAG